MLNIRGRKDFNYLTRTIKPEGELLIMGPITFKNNAFVMRPKLIIGSDRMELYEYFGRLNEVRAQTNKNLLKFGVVVTGLHFLTVQVPSLFSKFFGDDVGSVSRRLGSEDQSQELALIEVAKNKPKGSMPH